MRALRLVSAFAALLALPLEPLARAQTETLGAAAAKPSTAGTPALCAIEGAVVKSTTGQPLKRALVTAQRVGGAATADDQTADTQRVAHTDAYGHFALRNLLPGEYTIWVNRDGYLGLGYGQETPSSPGKTLKLAAGESKSDLLFRLIPTGAIVGRVYDEDGEPISGVSVQALRYSYVNGSRQLNQVSGSNTNDLGEYRLTGLAADKYFVSAIYGATDAADDESPEAYAPVYYPGTPDPGAAATVDVRAGDETPIDFNLIPVPAVRIRGRILNPEVSRPGVGVNVGLLQRQNPQSFTPAQVSLNTSQGTFEIRSVPPGSYYVLAQMWDRRRPYYAREAIEVGNSDVNDVMLTLSPGAEVRGRLRAEGQSQLKFTDGPSQVDLTGLQINLQPREPEPFGVSGANLAPDGSFVFKNVPDGTYDVMVCCLPQDLYVKSAQQGSNDALREGLKLVESEPQASGLDVVVSTSGGHIEGRVTSDGKPAGAATVVLVPDASRRDQTRLYSNTPSDPQGAFSLGSIPPGDYSLFAWRQIEDGIYFDPDFLRQYENQGKTIHVDPGAKLHVDLELITGEDGR